MSLSLDRATPGRCRRKRLRYSLPRGAGCCTTVGRKTSAFVSTVPTATIWSSFPSTVSTFRSIWPNLASIPFRPTLKNSTLGSTTPQYEDGDPEDNKSHGEPVALRGLNKSHGKDKDTYRGEHKPVAVSTYPLAHLKRMVAHTMSPTAMQALATILLALQSRLHLEAGGHLSLGGNLGMCY
jgi:hypothetical protein